MRTHIAFALLALVLTACASKEERTPAQAQKEEYRQEQQSEVIYSQFDGQSGREGSVSERQ